MTSALDPIPFITDARIVALADLAARGAIVINWQKDSGDGPRVVARTVADVDAIEALGRALLSVAAVARLNRDKLTAGGEVLPGHAPRAEVNLMRALATSPRHSIVPAPRHLRRAGAGE